MLVSSAVSYSLLQKHKAKHKCKNNTSVFKKADS